MGRLKYEEPFFHLFLNILRIFFLFGAYDVLIVINVIIMHLCAEMGEIMIQKLWNNRESRLLLWFLVLLIIYFFMGCGGKTDNTSKGSISQEESPQAVSYSSTTIQTDDDTEETFVYHPVNNVLSKIRHHKNTYSLSSWQQESGWTTEVESWKISKNCTLENFTYNTNGTLYACQKKKEKGKLIQQALVRLGKNGKIHKVRLTDLNHLSKSSPSSKGLPEIADLQCNGTSIAITYRYGTVKIYNLAEGQALGASTLTGTPGQNTFYDFHYLTIENKEEAQSIILRNYDIRSGDATYTFPLGGPGQDSNSFHLSHYQNDLYLQTPQGIFAGQCTEATLTKILDYADLKLPKESRITYFQAGRDNTLYLGYLNEKEVFCLQLLSFPDNQTNDTKQESNSQTKARI